MAVNGPGSLPKLPQIPTQVAEAPVKAEPGRGAAGKVTGKQAASAPTSQADGVDVAGTAQQAAKTLQKAAAKSVAGDLAASTQATQTAPTTKPGAARASAPAAGTKLLPHVKGTPYAETLGIPKMLLDNGANAAAIEEAVGQMQPADLPEGRAVMPTLPKLRQMMMKGLEEREKSGKEEPVDVDDGVTLTAPSEDIAMAVALLDETAVVNAYDNANYMFGGINAALFGALSEMSYV